MFCHALVRKKRRRITTKWKISKVVAVGECGLDFHYNRSVSNILSSVQFSSFALRLKIHPPVIIKIHECTLPDTM